MNDEDESFDNPQIAAEYEVWIDAKPEPLAQNFEGWLTDEFNKAAGKIDHDPPPTLELTPKQPHVPDDPEKITPKDADTIRNTLPPPRINSPKF